MLEDFVCHIMHKAIYVDFVCRNANSCGVFSRFIYFIFRSIITRWRHSGINTGRLIGWVINTSVLYSGGSRFKSLLGWRVSWLSLSRFSSVCPDKYCNSTLKSSHDHFQFLWNLSFISHTFIRLCINVHRKASLNKLYIKPNKHPTQIFEEPINSGYWGFLVFVQPKNSLLTKCLECGKQK